MTCRIDRILIEQGGVILRVSGRLAGRDLEVLRAVLEGEEGVVSLDLQEVGLADGEAVEPLSLSEANGIELRNCPAYIRDWIAAEGALANRESEEPGE